MKKKAARRTHPGRPARVLLLEAEEPEAGPLTSLSVRLSRRARGFQFHQSPRSEAQKHARLSPLPGSHQPRATYAYVAPRRPCVPRLPSPRLVGPHARARIEAPKTEGGGALTPRDPAVRVRRGVGVGEIRPATSVRTSGGRLARPGRRIPEEDPGICGQARVLHHYYCGARWLCNVRLVLPPACVPAPVYSTSVNSVAGGPRFAGGRAPPDLPARVAAPPAILFKEIRRLHFGDILRDPLKKKKKKGVCCCAAGRGG